MLRSNSPQYPLFVTGCIQRGNAFLQEYRQPSPPIVTDQLNCGKLSALFRYLLKRKDVSPQQDKSNEHERLDQCHQDLAGNHH